MRIRPLTAPGFSKAKLSALAVSILAASIVVPFGGKSAKAFECGNVGAGVTVPNDDGNSSNTACGDGAVATGANSPATGADASASGGASTATGYEAAATGQNSTATGNSAVASGAASTATGFSSLATSLNATATGHTAAASGNGSTATGQGAQATGDDAVATGHGAVASGGASSAIGQGAEASGAGSTALGSTASATGLFSSAIGGASNAGHFRSAAFGQGATTTRDDQQVFGTSTNTYTMRGVATDASRAAQGAPTHIVTSNANGDLAAHTLADLGLASASDVSALQSQIDGLGKRDEELAEGIAIALALESPGFQSGQSFAMRMGYGNFGGTSAVGLSAAGIVHRGSFGANSSVSIDAGVGFGITDGTVAGKAGLSFGW